MRKDAKGMFWEDEPKANVKPAPPYRYWEEEGYAPDHQSALEFIHSYDRFTDQELVELSRSPEKQELLWDVEVYPNYYCVLFKHDATKKFIAFERREILSINELPNLSKLKWVFDNFTVVGFNSRNFDCVIATVILAGGNCREVKKACDMLILEEERGDDVLRMFGLPKIEFDSIDLIEVAPLKANLKIYGGRLHTKRMQDLPFKPDTELTEAQADIVFSYCANDLEQTGDLRKCLSEQIALRKELGSEYKLDLRSKSDAQIAETVLAQELTKKLGRKLHKPKLNVGERHKYDAPHFLFFNSPLMRHVFKTVINAEFVVNELGRIDLPPEVDALKIRIGNTDYQMGVGGLHSCEKSAAHEANDGYRLIDRDVASYYPNIILNCNLYPNHLGIEFLNIYRTIVAQRLAAKTRVGEIEQELEALKMEVGDNVLQKIKLLEEEMYRKKSETDTKKTAINGSFGKLGSHYSILFAPKLLMQVTMTGQLSLLMLIERLELTGISVVSANTDGIVMKVHVSQENLLKGIIEKWEKDTGFNTEATEYLAMYSRDVNNYIAIKKKFDKKENRYISEPDGFKGKGAFADPWGDKKSGAMVLHKNPSSQICIQAVVAHITTGADIETFMRSCADIKQFISVRTVKGGGYKEGYGYLGKSVRWYTATGETAPIVYAQSGNKVPKTDGAKPCMTLPDALPDDIDYGWYVREAQDMLVDLGFTQAT